MRGMNRTIRMCLRFAALLAALSMTHCGLPLRFEIDQIKSDNPGMVPSLLSSGLIDVVPFGEAGTCGPNSALAGIIPDCPLPGICFTAACVNHDICYSTCGTQQAVCDQVFFWDMIYLCDSSTSNFTEQNECYSMAWIYAQAVSIYGDSYFPNTQEIVCTRDAQKWIPDGQVFDDTARAAEALGPAPFVDMDNDLMPDEWETIVGLDPTDPADAWLDYDGDGLVNLGEYTHGMDPYVQ